MVIQVDSREKARAIAKVLAEFDRQGIKHYTSKLFVGDYMSMDNPKVIIDRKQNLLEICGNVCQQHKRFTAELARAKDCGIHIVILCEHGQGIEFLEDVIKWVNPRLKQSPMAVSGERLYRILSSISKKYDVDFQFCEKKDTGKRIIEILSGENNELRSNH